MRYDLDPEDRDKTSLKLPAVLDCPECNVPQDHVFDAGEGVYDMEDLEEAPEELVTCVSCGHTWLASYEGWTIHTEA